MRQKKFTLISFLFLVIGVIAQEKKISGTLIHAVDDTPLPGVNVIVKGTSTGAQTDFDGAYTINASVGDILVFSFIGFKTVEIAIGSSNTVNISLEEDTEQLDDVVITAFGIRQESKKLGYSVQQIESKTITQAADPNIGTALRGKLAGVNINSNAGGIGSSVSINIRGISSLGANNQPLIVLDGVIIDDNQGGQGDFASGLDYGNTE